MEAVQHHSGHGGHHEEGFWSKYIFSTDHKMIGLQYIWTSLMMGLIGGYFAFVFRFNLAWPGESIPLYNLFVSGPNDGAGITPLAYNTLVTNHGAIMIFWLGMGVLVAGLGNIIIPLMIGADDMVFPRLNRLSFQVFFLSAVILVLSFFVDEFGGFNGAWTIYPPLSTKTGATGTGGLGGTFFILAVALEFVAVLIGGINFITTLFNARTKGMGLMDVPMAAWMVVIASIIFMLSVGPLVAGAFMLLTDRLMGTGFYAPAMGGDPVLFQHLFWFFGHPEVYVLLLPALGIAAEIITANARKTIFGYKMILVSTLATGALSFIVWAHHQFIAGIDPRMAQYFSLVTLIISIPVAVIMFSFIATLYGGSITFNASMLWALGLIGEFIIGGVTGIHLGSTAVDIYLHDNYFVVAHFHYTMLPLVVYGTFAMLTHWYPKLTGRLMSETLGKISFWLFTIGFNWIFIPLFFSGLAGQHRRIQNYDAFPDIKAVLVENGWDQQATYGLFVLLTGVGVFVVNFLISYKKGEVADTNPWKATTLDWQTSNPPPHGNFPEEVEVFRGPYEYSVPGAKEDYIPQNQKG